MAKQYRAQIHFIDQVKECLDLAIQIQNEELATVFVNMQGHVNEVLIDIHYPYWQADKRCDERLQFYCEKDEDTLASEHLNDRINPVINRLKEILATADQRKTDAEVLEEAQKKQRLETFKKLQEEFGYLQSTELQKAS